MPGVITEQALVPHKVALLRGEGVAFAGGDDDGWRRPVFYMHGEGGLGVNDRFLLTLARKRRVIAPLLPGFGANPDDSKVRDMLDFTLLGLDLLAASGLRDPIIVGHSMGGMIAAEMAAIAPDKVGRLGLIAPMGLWLDEPPMADLFASMPHELPGLLFGDAETGRGFMNADGVPGGGLDTDVLDGVNDQEARIATLLRHTRQMGVAGKLLFPIPDRGLAQRLHRIQAKTVIVWGAEDRLAAPAYGRAFAAAIKHSRFTLVPQAGRMVHWERPASVQRALEIL